MYIICDTSVYSNITRDEQLQAASDRSDATACLQRGLDLPSLDVTYFTSLSYYILLLFGLRGVFTLWFREETIDETQMYRQQMGMAGGGMPGMDNKKMFEGECSALEMVCPFNPETSLFLV